VFVARLKRREGDGLTLLLSRSILPSEVADTAVDMLFGGAESGGRDLQGLLDRLGGAAALENPRAPQVRENAGALVAAALCRVSAREGDVRGVRVSKIAFPGSELADVSMRDSVFDGVHFRRADLTRTRLLECRAIDVEMFEVMVDASVTRLELAGLDVRGQVLGLQVREGGAVRLVYDPVELYRILAACGAAEPEVREPTRRRVAADVLAILDKLSRAYLRKNPVCAADPTLTAVFESSEWPDLEELLVRHGVVTRESRAAGGPRKAFFRRQFLPEQIMAGASPEVVVPPEIRSFWDALEEAFPARQ
jgi:hypothetical protein